MYKNIKSLCCACETSIKLQINCISILKKTNPHYTSCMWSFPKVLTEIDFRFADIC